MSTSDDAPRAERARKIPPMLGYILAGWLAAVGIYATFAAFTSRSMSDLAHTTVVTVLALAAIAWLAALVIVEVDRRVARRVDAVTVKVVSEMGRRVSTLASMPDDLRAAAEEVYAAGYVAGARERMTGQPGQRGLRLVVPTDGRASL